MAATFARTRILVTYGDRSRGTDMAASPFFQEHPRVLGQLPLKHDQATWMEKVLSVLLRRASELGR